MLFLFRALRPHLALLVAATLVSLFSGMAQIVGMSAFLPIISILQTGDVSSVGGLPFLGRVAPLLPTRAYVAVILLAVIVCGAMAVRAMVQASVLIIQMRVKNLIDSVLSKRALAHWLELAPSQQTGHSQSRVKYICGHEIALIGQGTSSVIQMTAAVILAATVSGFLFLASWKLMLGVVGFLVVVLIPVYFLIRWLLRKTGRDAKFIASYTQEIYDLIDRTTLVNVFQTHLSELGAINAFFYRFLRVRRELDVARAIAPRAVELGVAVLVCLLVIGISIAGPGQQAIEDLVLLVGGAIALQPPLAQMTLALGQIGRVGAAIAHMNEILTLAPDRRPSGKAGQPSGPLGVRVEGLTFAYPQQSAPVFQGLTLEMPAASLSLLFGASGAGKTTLLKLLQRLERPLEGAIFVGKIAVETIAPDSWRRTALLMPQDTVIKPGTIAENICYGGEVSDADLQWAAEMACVSEIAQQLPQGVNTRIGPGGVQLSGGQLQRIALARVLAMRPSILILDEPTSALDREVEQRVMNNLLALRQLGHTIIMSTHKVDLATHADQIFWFGPTSVEQLKLKEFELGVARLFPPIGATGTSPKTNS